MFPSYMQWIAGGSSFVKGLLPNSTSHGIERHASIKAWTYGTRQSPRRLKPIARGVRRGAPGEIGSTRPP